MIRRPVLLAGRMGRIDEMWMGCCASLTVGVLNVRRMGMRCGRAPPGALLRAARFLPSDRPHLVPAAAVCRRHFWKNRFCSIEPTDSVTIGDGCGKRARNQQNHISSGTGEESLTRRSFMTHLL